MIAELFLMLAAAPPGAAQDTVAQDTVAEDTGAEVSVAEVSIPGAYIAGQPFVVEVRYESGADGRSLEAWRLEPAAFERNGEPLAERDSTAPVKLPKGSSISLKLDLSEYLTASETFSLALAGAGEAGQRDVSVFQAAPEDADFMSMPVEQLDDYVVMLQTNRGNIVVEFWPDVAPNHVRNFLDLAHSGFYDGILFHRTSPNFMIQGGCPNTKTDRRNTWGSGRGPRMLEAEFSDKDHVRGVLSMARGMSPDSASSQFFLMTAHSPHLNGKYSAFGKMVSGFDALDRIANAPGQVDPRDQTKKPNEPQRIENAVVLLGSSD